MCGPSNGTTLRVGRMIASDGNVPIPLRRTRRREIDSSIMAVRSTACESEEGKNVSRTPWIDSPGTRAAHADGAPCRRLVERYGRRPSDAQSALLRRLRHGDGLAHGS